MEVEIANINIENGVTVKDVPAGEFIKAFAAYLKKSNKFKIPEWSEYVKTGIQKDLAPYDPDWLFIRAAAVARQVYFKLKIGVNTLRGHFGTAQRRGTRRQHYTKSAGKAIRYALKQLSDMGIVDTIVYKVEDDKGTESILNSDGRKITKKGVADMDRIAKQVAKELKGARRLF